jgi:hypothetical protein
LQHGGGVLARARAAAQLKFKRLVANKMWVPTQYTATQLVVALAVWTT